MQKGGVLKFESVLVCLRDDGDQVRRLSWADPETRICFMPAVTVPAGLVNGRTKKFWPEGADLKVTGYFVKIHKGQWSPGWRPSSDDMTADDWVVVDY